MDQFKRASLSASYLRGKINSSPETAIILGTGLGKLTTQLRNATHIPYSDIPYFNLSSAPSHKGECVAGLLGDASVLCFSGRFHYYEGIELSEVTFPIRVMKLLNIKRLILSNSAGSVNPVFHQGEIIIIKDHINLQPDNPLRGRNEDRFGVRFPDMKDAYDPILRDKAKVAGHAIGLDLREGVYVCLPGPSLETPAEYKFIHIIGGDLVGMSTAPEVITARHCNINVLALSIVTNVCYPPERIQVTTAEKVISAAEKAAPTLNKLIIELLNAEHSFSVSA
jgi:purine-nucleoside phosphorylase